MGIHKKRAGLWACARPAGKPWGLGHSAAAAPNIAIRKRACRLGHGSGGALQGRHEMPARDVENIREKALCPARCNANGAADLACHGDQRRLAGYAVRAKAIFS